MIEETLTQTFESAAEKHFRNEEIIMETWKYTERKDHTKEHADLLDQLFVLKNKLDSGSTPFGEEYMKSLRKWLEEHLLDADNRLDKFLYQINAK